jgi:uncharacterized protein YdgA (DUF945 family)
MKKLVVAIVLLVLILGVAPWGVGKIAEARVNKGLDRLVQEAPYLTIVERKWTGGWFRSEQEVTFEFFGAWLNGVVTDASRAAPGSPGEGRLVKVADEAVQEPMPEAAEGEMDADEPAAEGDEPKSLVIPPSMRLTVKNEILHGPVLWTSGLGLAEVRTKIVLGEEFRKMLVEAIGTDEPVRVKTRVGLFGGGTTTLYGDARTVRPKKEPGEVSWDEFKLAMSYSGDLDSFEIDGRQPRLEIKNPSDGSHIVLRKAEISGQAKRIVGDLYDTDMKMTLAQITAKGADGKSFALDDVHYIVETDENGDFVDIVAKMGSGALTSAELDATGVKLKEVHYDFSLRRLHSATLAKMSAKMKEVYSKPLDVTNSAQAQAALFGPLKDDAISLFKHDPEFAVDRIGIVTPEGEGVIKGVVKFKGVTEEDFANPMAIIPKLDADFSVEVPVKLVEKIPNGATMAGAAVDGGYMKRDGEKLTCKITFKNGELTVNGKAQPLPFGGPPGGGMAPDGMPPDDMGEPPAEEMPAPQG